MRPTRHIQLTKSSTMSFVRLTQMQAIILQRISVYFVSFYILSLGMEEEVTEKYVLLEENLKRGEKKRGR